MIKIEYKPVNDDSPDDNVKGTIFAGSLPPEHLDWLDDRLIVRCTELDFEAGGRRDFDMDVDVLFNLVRKLTDRGFTVTVSPTI